MKKIIIFFSTLFKPFYFNELREQYVFREVKYENISLNDRSEVVQWTPLNVGPLIPSSKL